MNALRDPRRATARATLGFATIGFASGLRSSTGLASALLTRRTPPRTRNVVAAALLVSGEFAADKHPGIPSRLSPPALSGRVVAGAPGARALALRDETSTAAALCLGAVAGSFGGARWRRWAGGYAPDWQAAVVEDGAALGLAAILISRP